MTTVYQCTNDSCTHVFPENTLIKGKCPICGGDMKDITGTKLGDEFIAIVSRIVPQAVQHSYMHRHLVTDQG